MSCELCAGDGGRVLFRDADLRIVAVEGAEAAAWPGFCRVVWNSHVREMTDLDAPARQRFMDAVFRLEIILRTHLAPTKINLACLGNLTPHLHWHVIPRYADDAAWPNPVWTAAPTPLPRAPAAGWEAAVLRAFEPTDV